MRTTSKKAFFDKAAGSFLFCEKPESSRKIPFLYFFSRLANRSGIGVCETSIQSVLEIFLIFVTLSSTVGREA